MPQMTSSIFTVLNTLKGAADNSGTQVIVPAGTFRNWLTILNRDDNNGLVIGAGQVDPTSDFVIAPGEALTFPFGLASDLYGASTAASTLFVCIGH